MLLTIAVLAAFVSSCVENNKIDNTFKRTVLVYMAADNSLAGNATNNIMSITSGIRNENDNANMLVFVDIRGNLPVLMYIHNGQRDTLVRYNELDSTDPNVLSDAIEYMVEHFPSESYGLVLWSHGQGWLPTAQLHYVAPKSYVQSRDGQTPYLSVTNGLRDPFAKDIVTSTKPFAWEDRAGQTPPYKCMEIDDMVNAIPDGLFDFIAFDACYMGCVEVIYALRHKADYIISSCYEVIADGLPYYIVALDLLKGDLMKVCREYHTYYNTLDVGNRMAGISLVKTDGLYNLAKSFGKIVDYYKDEIPGFDINNVQLFDRFDNHVFFDLEDFVEKLDVEKKFINEFRLQLERFVTYKISTPKMFPNDADGRNRWGTTEVNIDKYCGMSVYIPIEKYEASGLNSDYKKTDWSIDSGYGQ